MAWASSPEEMHESLEQRGCTRFLRDSVDEQPFEPFLQIGGPECGLIVTEGFEERSFGILKSCADNGYRMSEVIIARYPDKPDSPNARYRLDFEAAAPKVSRSVPAVVPNSNDGEWVEAAIAQVTAPRVILDITGISNRALFPVLDRAVASKRDIYIAYSEAGEYWPKKHDWEQMRADLADPIAIADKVDKAPWLFGPGHRVEYVPGHEGYDSAGADRALVAFLPYKAARLAAILGEEDYSAFVFISGKPRLSENIWRLEALETINRRLTKGRPVVQMETFGYRNTFHSLVDLLLVGANGSDPLLSQYNVHIALMGSKLQNVACWAFSCLVPPITIVTTSPIRYYHKAFSDGIGVRWVFPLTKPSRLEIEGSA